MPVKTNAGFYIGAALYFAGMILMFVIMARAGGYAFGFQALRNIRNYVKNGTNRAKASFWIALLLMCSGGLILFASLLGGDATRNNQCRVACGKAGHNGGRFRVNPHVSVREAKQKRLPYRCWCRTNGKWSTKPVELPADLSQ